MGDARTGSAGTQPAAKEMLPDPADAVWAPLPAAGSELHAAAASEPRHSSLGETETRVRRTTAAGVSAWASRAVFLALLLQLPFEVPRPLFHVGPLAFTNLEISIGLLLLLTFLATRHPRDRKAAPRIETEWRRVPARLRSPGLWIAVWILALLASVVFAPDRQAHAAKFLVRSAGMAALFWASRSVLSPAGTASRAARNRPGGGRLSHPFLLPAVLVGVGTLTACFGLLEDFDHLPVERFLRVFRPVPTVADGVLRLTASFSHANQAAAFLAMILPLAGALILTTRGRIRLLWIGAGAILLWALCGTLSRAGVGAGLAGFGLVAVFHLPPRATRRAAAALLIGAAVLVVARWGLDPGVRARVRTGPGERSFAAAYQVPASLMLTPGQAVKVPVRVRNESSLAWSPHGAEPFKLAYHAVRAVDGSTAVFDGVRTPLPGVVPPGGDVALAAWVVAPFEAGRFLVTWDMVREHISWFSWQGVSPGITKLTVASPDSQAGAAGAWDGMSAGRVRELAGRVQGTPTFRSIGRPALWKRAWELFLARPATGWGLDTYRYRYAQTLGPGLWDERMHANNQYLELAADCGVIGLLGYLGVLVTLVGAGLGAPGLRRGDQALRVGLLGAIVAFALHGLFDSFLEFYGNMSLFWIIAGALALALGPDAVAREAAPAGRPQETKG